LESKAHNAPCYTGIEDKTAATHIPRSQSSTSRGSSRTVAAHVEEDSPIRIACDRDVESNLKKTRTRSGMTELQLAQTKSEGGAIYIEFEPGDKDDPFNWSSREQQETRQKGCFSEPC
jgi:hypothetical protein